MIGPVKIVAALAMLVTVQNTVRSPPTVDQLHESAKELNARLGTNLAMNLVGCNSTALTCSYKVFAIPIEAHADAPKGPIKRVKIEYLGGKENAHYVAVVAEFLADLLIPNAPVRASVDLQRKMDADFAGIFGIGSAKLGPYEFEYQTTDKATVLTISIR